MEVVHLLLADSRVDASDLNNLSIQLASRKGLLEVVRLLLDIDDSRVFIDINTYSFIESINHWKIYKFNRENNKNNEIFKPYIKLLDAIEWISIAPPSDEQSLFFLEKINLVKKGGSLFFENIKELI